MEDRRSSERFPVKIRVHCQANSSQQESEGVIVELGIQGCRIESENNHPLHSYIELQVYDSLASYPLNVELAAVRWVRDTQAGVEFLSLQSDHKARLEKVIKQASDSNVHD